jgi:uncharacterized repeat protein (TIGR03803 family)
MRSSPIGPIVSLAAIVAVSAGCSNSSQSAQALPTVPAIAREAGGLQPRYGSSHRLALTERLIHSFGFAGSGDGYDPEVALLNVNGTLYGTTTYGGASGSGCYGTGCGTVFKVGPGGETVLHSFTGSDGLFPVAKLINVNGTLYGTTFDGGTNNTGTVFSITQSGQLNTIYSFGSSTGADGQNPHAALINVNGTLYGTTNYGGTSGNGTVFSITTTGQETVLYSFGTGSDGSSPLADLINVNGVLYGTTTDGGTYGGGTVFSVTTSGSEKVLHSFTFRGTDGTFPEQGLTNVNGTLCGTTAYGGTSDNGTVFAMDLSGHEKVLYSFAGSPDGSLPSATLLNLKGTLYGTTGAGGASNDGTVFTITRSGQETVLYSFKGHNYTTGQSDGDFPEAGLINVNGSLYGTTSGGGFYVGECHSPSGCGTIFKLTP